MSIKLGSTLLAGVATNTIENAHELFDFIWSDHIKNSLSWLRADTFSWQSGEVYVAAYNHLVADNSGGTSQTETVGSYTITYVLADDGHKITTDETTVANIYAESGVAWYYVLDTVNQRFKLPRTKYGFTGLRDSVGNYVEAGLPNITGTLVAWNDVGIFSRSQVGAFENDTSGNTNRWPTSNTSSDSTRKVSFDASKSNSIYGNSTTVQPPATQMYLYFYVGNFSQSATEQTAGLNASLFNGKADTDLTNIDNTNNVASTALNTAGIRTVIETYQNGTDWYRIYSDGWCEQGGKTGIFATSLQTFTLLKQYKDTNYSVVFGTYHNQGATSTWNASDNKMPIISVQYVGSFNAWCRFEGKCGAFWEASGYIS